MTLRCGQCGARFRPPLGRAGRELRCPVCGAPVPEPVPAVAAPAPPAAEEPRRPDGFSDQVPRALALVIGILVLAVMSAPFWLAHLLDQGKSRPRLLPLEGAATELAPPAIPAPARLPVAEPRVPSPSGVGQQFLDVRLDMTREQLALRYHLQLRNTRGMVPEIYQAADQPGLKLLVAHFYQNLLKEFYVVTEPRRTVPPTLIAELRRQLGSPGEWSLAAEPVPGPGLGQQAAAWSRLLTDYRWQQRLAWTDGDHRLEATIYATSLDPQLCTSLLMVHVTDVRWLEQNRPLLPAATAPALPESVPLATNAVPAAPAEERTPGEPFRLLPE